MAGCETRFDKTWKPGDFELLKQIFRPTGKGRGPCHGMAPFLYHATVTRHTVRL